MNTGHYESIGILWILLCVKCLNLPLCFVFLHVAYRLLTQYLFPMPRYRPVQTHEWTNKHGTICHMAADVGGGGGGGGQKAH